MKHLEHAIVIQRKPYSETSVLLTAFCRESGLKTFLFQGAKKKNAQILFPTSLVEIQYYQRNDSAMPKISAIAFLDHTFQLPEDPIKSSIAFFIADIIRHIVKPDQADSALFSFLMNEIQWLNTSSEYTNYPIWLLKALAEEMGILPQIEDNSPDFFDYINGKLTSNIPQQPVYVTGNWLNTIVLSIQLPKNEFLAHPISKENRNQCLTTWLEYYAVHFHQFNQLKSLEVIRMVM